MGSQPYGRERMEEFGRLERKLRDVAGTPFLKWGQLVMERRINKGNWVLSPEMQSRACLSFN